MNDGKRGAAGRRERERVAHRMEILDAAERVFVSKGFETATVEQIAREAEFSVGAIYNFFKNKEALCGAVVGKIVDDFLSEFESRILRENDPLKAIVLLVELRLTHMRRHRAFLQRFLDYRPGVELGPDLAFVEGVRAAYEKYVGQVSRVFRKAMDRGDIRTMDPLYAALALEGVLNGFCAYWGRREGMDSIETRVEAVKKNYLDHIVARREGRKK